MTFRLLAISLPVLALVGCSTKQSEPAPTTPAAPEQSTQPSQLSSAESGKKIYGAYCASCHGPEAKGDGPAAKGLTPAPANLSRHRVGPHPSGKNRWEIIMTGSEGTAMIAFGKVLQPDQLDHLHSYLRQLMHGQSRPAHGTIGAHADDGAGCPGGGGGFGGPGQGPR